jgi:hypothetical protein
MGLFHMHRASAWWVGSAVIALVFASSTLVLAQEEKNKEKEKAKTQTPTQTQTKPAGTRGDQGAAAGRSGGAGQTGKADASRGGERAGNGRAGGRDPGQTGQTGKADTSHAGQTDELHRGRSGDAQGRGSGGGQSGQGQAGAAHAGQPGNAQSGPTRAGRTDSVHTASPARPGQAGTTHAGQADTPRGPSRPRADDAQGVHTRNGGTVYRRSDGTLREVHTARGAVIVHAPGGAAYVRTERPGGQVMVANRAGYGYVARPFHGGAFVQRTYFVNGAHYVNVYRPYRWGGSVFQIYFPVRYYQPGFYSWLWDPWARPVYYTSWGWSGRPWYEYSSSYFGPYRNYAAPRFWLTDFMLAAILEQAYLDRADASAASYPPNEFSSTGEVGLTPDVKQAIADEVQRQLELERSQSEAVSQISMAPSVDDSLPPSLSGPGPHVFVVSQGLDVTVVTDGRPCSVTGGDVLQMDRVPPPGATAARVVVLASRRQDCPKRSVVSVPLQELVEMQNRMRETLDRGLQSLQSHQGQGGLPTLPAMAAAPPVDAPYAVEATPDPNVADELRAASQDAVQAEQEVVGQAEEPSSAPAGQVRISLGQTIAEVQAALGAPAQIVDLGSKKIYVYKNLKITFIDGRVTDVQ